jgi:hypothetical protein
LTWNAPAAITYGTALSGTQLNAVESASLAGTFAYTPAAATVLNAGAGQTLSVLFTPTDTTNYNTATTTTTITVTKLPINVTANDAGRAFGVANPTFTSVFGTFVSPDTAGSLGLTAPTPTTTATASSPIGTYPITVDVTGLTATNYSFVAVNGTLTVTAFSATASISGNAAVYDGTAHSVTVTTNPPGLATAVTYNGSSTPPTAAGTYAVNVTITDANYDGSASGTLTISPAALSVSADNASRPFGTANSTFTGNITGVASTDTITATYASSADGTTAIGVYGPSSPQAITPTLVDPGSKLANYTVTSTNGTLTITAGSATVTLANTVQTYNGTPRPVTVTTTPSGLTTTVTYNGSATAPTLAGSYTVVATITGGTYSGAATDTLVIAPAPLTITANNATRAFGATNPTFSGSITGLATGDVITATYASSANASTPIGVYGPTTAEAITPTLVDPGSKLSNYTLTTNTGTLTITAITATVTMASQSVIYDGKPKPLTAVTVPAGLATTITYDGSTEVPVKLGTYTAVATITAPGYTATPVTATLTIRLAPGQEYPTSGGDSCGTGSGVAVVLLGAFLALGNWLRPRRR